MTQPAINAVTENPSSARSLTQPKSQAWYRPTLSHEHGVYVVLLVSFLTGAALAQAWTLATTLALVCAFFGFQAEHPIVLQIKQRRSLKPRFLVWGGMYSAVSVAIAFWLYLSSPVLLWLYLGAVAALVVDAVSVLHREQKSIFNEFITFTAVCLAAPLAEAVTTGTISATAMGLWVLNTLYFSSTIFTVKLRKTKTSSPVPGVVYHAIATLIVATLYHLGWLPLIATLAFGLALLKFGIIALYQKWYRTAKIQWVAMIETGTAFGFLVIVVLSLLPAHLT
ncbi:YwiC-like family protein [Allocoleopsis sp.]|uniref:YwiC-like family protein n=1 Tax=Allocoleopsis sp. TaxID=3088169 RepID=UPI002FD5073F